MKKIVRNQTSARPSSSVTKTIKKSRKRGGKGSKHRTVGTEFYLVKGHRNNQCKSMLAKMHAREARRLSLNVQGMAKRHCEQLCALGKLARNPSVKNEGNIPERWAQHVPLEVHFSVEGLLKAMVLGIE